MRFTDLYIRGTGVALPPRQTVTSAVGRGECPAHLADMTGVTSVAVSPGESAAELGVLAGRQALERAGSEPCDVDLILHANTYYQGYDLWAVASYIQRETVRNQCPALEVHQMSNGGMGALTLAASYLAAAPSRRDALLTTADRYCLPGVDRWRTDPGTPFADGGTALVLSRRGGYARLVSLAMLADSELEPLHRGEEPFGSAPLSHRAPLRFDAAAKAFNRRHGLSFGFDRVVAGVVSVAKQALADAEIELDTAKWTVLPHFGRLRLESLYYNPLGIDPARTTWSWSRTVGHLGAGDQFASLDYLVTSGRAVPGDRCVLMGSGAGYSWGCAVVEIVGRPGWAAPSGPRQQPPPPARA